MDLTQTTFDRQIQIYTACAVKKGAMYIDGLKEGKDCKELYNEARIMMGLIESIRGFDLTVTSCISNEQIQIILNKLKKLCSLPCKEVINFQDGCLEADQGGWIELDQSNEKLCQDQST